jgi:ferredoxin
MTQPVKTNDETTKYKAVTKAITAIKQARALDKKAENARELGLDYEPPCKTGGQCTSKCQQCVVQQPKEEHMNNDFTLGIQGTVESNITFLTNSSKEAMRIDKNGVKVNPDFPMDEAAQYVIKALDEHIKILIHAEREACAKLCEDDASTPEERICAAAIRNRGNT